MNIPLPAVNSAFGRGPHDRARPEVLFFYDVACPYVYLAVPRLLALAERLGAAIDWRPVSLPDLLRQGGGAPEVPPLLGGATRGELTRPLADRQAMARRDLSRWAEHLGVAPPLLSDAPRRTVEAQRLLCWSPQVVRPVLTQALLRACHQEGRDLANVSELLDIAAGVGLDERSARAAILGAGPRAELARRSEEAARAGVFGVPTFVVDSHSGPRLFFGQDRLPFVEEALRLHPLAPAAEPPPAPDPPAAEPLALPPANEARRVTFYYDFSSPFSYLASTQIEAIAAQNGAVVDWHPILLGGLFKSLGAPVVPIGTYSEAKRRHAREDMNRWAHRYDQPFHWPSRFPMVTVTALRLALLAEERRAALSHALFRAYWVEDADLNDPLTLEAALRRAGLDPALLERVGEPAVKQRLIANTEAALQAGVYGAPSFLVQQHHGPPQLFFGQDHLDFVARALHRG